MRYNSLQLHVDAVRLVGFCRDDSADQREIEALAAAEVEFGRDEYLEGAASDDARDKVEHVGIGVKLDVERGLVVVAVDICDTVSGPNVTYVQRGGGGTYEGSSRVM